MPKHIDEEKIGAAEVFTLSPGPPSDEPGAIIKPAAKLRSRNIIAAVLIAVVSVGGGAYLLSERGKKADAFPNSFVGNLEQCMFWTGDQYQPISCNEKAGEAEIIALDIKKLNQMRKITRPDTLTANSLGTVWYVKIGGSIEFYTSEGFHPIYNDRKLKPVTAYILNKYNN